MNRNRGLAILREYLDHDDEYADADMLATPTGRATRKRSDDETHHQKNDQQPATPAPSFFPSSNHQTTTNSTRPATNGSRKAPMKSESVAPKTPSNLMKMDSTLPVGGPVSPFSPLFNRKRPRVNWKDEAMEDLSLSICRKVSVVVMLRQKSKKICLFPPTPDPKPTEISRELIVVNPKAFGNSIPPNITMDTARLAADICDTADWARSYKFHQVVWPNQTTNALENLTQALANDILAPGSIAQRLVVAYGKTVQGHGPHTKIMFGSVAKQSVARAFASVESKYGDELLERYGMLGLLANIIQPKVGKRVFSVSILEVVGQDHLYDMLMLRPYSSKNPVKVKLHHQEVCAVVTGLSETQVDSAKQLGHLIRRAFSAALHPARKTPRGHILTTVSIHDPSDPSRRTACRFLDLACTETPVNKKAVLALGAVLRSTLLREAGNESPVSFRETLLTQVLQKNMIQTDSRVVVLASASTANAEYDKTLPTLRFMNHLLARPGDPVRSPFHGAKQNHFSHNSTEENFVGHEGRLLQEVLSDPRQRLAKVIKSAKKERRQPPKPNNYVARRYEDPDEDGSVLVDEPTENVSHPIEALDDPDHEVAISYPKQLFDGHHPHQAKDALDDENIRDYESEDAHHIMDAFFASKPSKTAAMIADRPSKEYQGRNGSRKNEVDHTPFTHGSNGVSNEQSVKGRFDAITNEEKPKRPSSLMDDATDGSNEKSFGNPPLASRTVRGSISNRQEDHRQVSIDDQDLQSRRRGSAHREEDLEKVSIDKEELEPLGECPAHWHGASAQGFEPRHGGPVHRLNDPEVEPHRRDPAYRQENDGHELTGNQDFERDLMDDQGLEPRWRGSLHRPEDPSGPANRHETYGQESIDGQDEFHFRREGPAHRSNYLGPELKSRREGSAYQEFGQEITDVQGLQSHVGSSALRPNGYDQKVESDSEGSTYQQENDLHDCTDDQELEQHLTDDQALGPCWGGFNHRQEKRPGSPANRHESYGQESTDAQDEYKYRPANQQGNYGQECADDQEFGQEETHDKELSASNRPIGNSQEVESRRGGPSYIQENGGHENSDDQDLQSDFNDDRDFEPRRRGSAYRQEEHGRELTIDQDLPKFSDYGERKLRRETRAQRLKESDTEFKSRREYLPPLQKDYGRDCIDDNDLGQVFAAEQLKPGLSDSPFQHERQASIENKEREVRHGVQPFQQETFAHENFDDQERSPHFQDPAHRKQDYGQRGVDHKEVNQPSNGGSVQRQLQNNSNESNDNPDDVAPMLLDQMDSSQSSADFMDEREKSYHRYDLMEGGLMKGLDNLDDVFCDDPRPDELFDRKTKFPSPSGEYEKKDFDQDYPLLTESLHSVLTGDPVYESHETTLPSSVDQEILSLAAGVDRLDEQLQDVGRRETFVDDVARTSEETNKEEPSTSSIGLHSNGPPSIDQRFPTSDIHRTDVAFVDDGGTRLRNEASRIKIELDNSSGGENGNRLEIRESILPVTRKRVNPVVPKLGEASSSSPPDQPRFSQKDSLESSSHAFEREKNGFAVMSRPTAGISSDEHLGFHEPEFDEHEIVSNLSSLVDDTNETTTLERLLRCQDDKEFLEDDAADHKSLDSLLRELNSVGETSGVQANSTAGSQTHVNSLIENLAEVSNNELKTPVVRNTSGVTFEHGMNCGSRYELPPESPSASSDEGSFQNSHGDRSPTSNADLSKKKQSHTTIANKSEINDVSSSNAQNREMGRKASLPASRRAYGLPESAKTSTKPVSIDGLEPISTSHTSKGESVVEFAPSDSIDVHQGDHCLNITEDMIQSSDDGFVDALTHNTSEERLKARIGHDGISTKGHYNHSKSLTSDGNTLGITGMSKEEYVEPGETNALVTVDDPEKDAHTVDFLAADSVGNINGCEGTIESTRLLDESTPKPLSKDRPTLFDSITENIDLSVKKPRNSAHKEPRSEQDSKAENDKTEHLGHAMSQSREVISLEVSSVTKTSRDPSNELPEAARIKVFQQASLPELNRHLQQASPDVGRGLLNNASRQREREFPQILGNASPGHKALIPATLTTTHSLTSTSMHHQVETDTSTQDQNLLADESLLTRNEYHAANVADFHLEHVDDTKSAGEQPEVHFHSYLLPNSSVATASSSSRSFIHGNQRKHLEPSVVGDEVFTLNPLSSTGVQRMPPREHFERPGGIPFEQVVASHGQGDDHPHVELGEGRREMQQKPPADAGLYEIDELEAAVDEVRRTNSSVWQTSLASIENLRKFQASQKGAMMLLRKERDEAQERSRYLEVKLNQSKESYLQSLRLKDAEVENLLVEISEVKSVRQEVDRIAEEAISTQAELEARVEELQSQIQNSVSLQVYESLRRECDFARKQLEGFEEKTSKLRSIVEEQKESIIDLKENWSKKDSESRELGHELSSERHNNSLLQRQIQSLTDKGCDDEKTFRVQLAELTEALETANDHTFNLEAENKRNSQKLETLKQEHAEKLTTIESQLRIAKKEAASNEGEWESERLQLRAELEIITNQLNASQSRKSEVERENEELRDQRDNFQRRLSKTETELDNRVKDITELSRGVELLLAQKEEDRQKVLDMEASLTSFRETTRSRVETVVLHRKEAAALLEKTMKENKSLEACNEALKKTVEGLSQKLALLQTTRKTPLLDADNDVSNPYFEPSDVDNEFGGTRNAAHTRLENAVAESSLTENEDFIDLTARLALSAKNPTTQNSLSTRQIYSTIYTLDEAKDDELGALKRRIKALERQNSILSS